MGNRLCAVTTPHSATSGPSDQNLHWNLDCPIKRSYSPHVAYCVQSHCIQSKSLIMFRCAVDIAVIVSFGFQNLIMEKIERLAIMLTWCILCIYWTPWTIFYDLKCWKKLKPSDELQHIPVLFSSSTFTSLAVFLLMIGQWYSWRI